MLCSFSKTIVFGFPQDPGLSSLRFLPVHPSSTEYGSNSWSGSYIQRWLVASIGFVPLLYHFILQVGHQGSSKVLWHCWYLAFFFGTVQNIFQHHEHQSHRGEGARWGPALPPHFQGVVQALSSAIGPPIASVIAWNVWGFP